MFKWLDYLVGETDKILRNYPQAEKLDFDRLKKYIESVIKNEKTFQFLESLTKNYELNPYGY